MMTLRFGFRSGKCNHDWQGESVESVIGGSSDISEGVCKQSIKQEDLYRNGLLPHRYFVILNHC